ncbi:m-AAA protease-interacting protein 1, mitochondrial [Takifugu flavidus]|uniref:M-AAA protease-interacting protein 1, mitochondrial n=1 Tax=Takifugu flavidus TaxID=433684 RepID=A0A5C6PN79_9TELE|nr:m-AAA protease-interacting protein 1, mitochondrial [Takifugu flavidus]
MALPILRRCHRTSLTASFTRFILSERTVLNRSCKTRLTSPSLSAVVTAVRPYSSDRDGFKQNQKVVFVGIPNPFIWLRTRIYYVLIKTYFDKDFTIEDFTEGAKQAFSHVSRLLSQCQFDALEGLVAKDLIGKLEEKCNLLPSTHKKALSANSDEIMYSTPGDVGIYYDDNGRKFVSILMRFWYLTSVCLPDDTLEGTHIFRVAISGDREAETRRLLTANYEYDLIHIDSKGSLPRECLQTGQLQG